MSSHLDRAKAVVSAKCSISIDVVTLSPNDLLEIARLAAAQQTKVTFRNCNNKAPNDIQSLLAVGQAHPGLFTFEM